MSGPGYELEPFLGQVLSLSLCLSLFSSLALPQFGLLSPISSLRLSAGHSGLVLTLRIDDATHASLSSPAGWWQMRASGLLLCWELLLGTYSVGFFFFFFLFLPVMLPSEIPKLPHRPACERVSYCLETSPSRLLPQLRSPSLTLLSLFLSFIFCPSSFQRE